MDMLKDCKTLCETAGLVEQDGEGDHQGDGDNRPGHDVGERQAQ